MYNAEELKEKLMIIQDQNEAVPQGSSPYQLALCMLDHIGSPDPELRDDLIYSILNNWITAGVFSNEELHYFVDQCLSGNGLFYRIGETDTDSVFQRSFHVLLLASIVFYHRKKPVFSGGKIREITEKAVEYYNAENDVRGYIAIKGWAHSAAHGADLLDEVAQCEETSRDDLINILEAIKLKACISSYAFVDQEDERMATAVVSALDREALTKSEIEEWINGFQHAVKERDYPQKYRQLTNIKAFLSSLYFRLLDEDGYQEITQAIKNTLSSIK